MWIYRQSSGAFSLGDELITTGYSGYGPHKNQPASESLPGLGPIPRGVYWIGAEHDSVNVGPVVMGLEPVTPPPEIAAALPGAVGTQTHGRSAFLLHGDSREHPGMASHGCIILPRAIRERVAESRDRLLVVLA